MGTVAGWPRMRKMEVKDVGATAKAALERKEQGFWRKVECHLVPDSG